MRRLGLLLSIVFGVAPAAVSQVYVSPSGDNSTGASWATAFTSVSAGVTAANSQSEDLWIAEGTYAIGSTISIPSNLTIYGGFPDTGSAVFGDRDPSGTPSILDANFTDHIFLLTNATGVVIDGVQFTRGTGSGSAGGAIRVVTNSTVTITGCRFFNNTASQYGGGVYVENAHADIASCIFDSNFASEAGAIMLFNGTATVSESTFTGNTGNQGGAILTYQVPITIDRCVFSGNSTTGGAGHGGAVAIREGDGGSITNSLFVGNTSSDHGAGVNYEFQTNTSIANCTFVDNTAALRGGGVFYHSSSGTLINNIFVNNSKNAVYENSSDADPVLKNNMFLSNADGVYFDEATTSYASAAALDAAVAQASGDLDNNPLFENAGAGDYHLQETSPARNAGIKNGSPAYDFDGEFRDAQPDIGFDEKDPGLPLGLPSALASAIAVMLIGGVFLRRRNPIGSAH